MRRCVKPELLDDLPPTDLRAVGSRADLQRLNLIMGHAGILSRALLPNLPMAPAPDRRLRLVELGAGDGTLLLRLARRWELRGVKAAVTFVDHQDLVSPETLRAFSRLGWSVECVAADVFTWLEKPSPIADAVVANLFLHHFPRQRLKDLLRLAALRTDRFVACEPRRSTLVLAVSRWLWLMGCNRVTRHDALVSVRAGFVRREISACWPEGDGWKLVEQPAGLFSHCFFAQRSSDD